MLGAPILLRAFMMRTWMDNKSRTSHCE